MRIERITVKNFRLLRYVSLTVEGETSLGDFTFKRWELTEDGARLSPVSNDKKFKPILLTPEDEPTMTHVARFIEVLRLDEADVQ